MTADTVSDLDKVTSLCMHHIGLNHPDKSARYSNVRYPLCCLSDTVSRIKYVIFFRDYDWLRCCKLFIWLDRTKYSPHSTNTSIQTKLIKVELSHQTCFFTRALQVFFFFFLALRDQFISLILSDYICIQTVSLFIGAMWLENLFRFHYICLLLFCIKGWGPHWGTLCHINSPVFIPVAVKFKFLLYF